MSDFLTYLSDFISLLISSLQTGSIYSLATLAIVLIYKTSTTTNFAQGSIGTFNAFVAAVIFNSWGWNMFFVTIGAMTSAVITGIIIDTLIIRPAAKVGIISKQIITLGLIMIILGIIPMIFGIDSMRLDPFIPTTPENQIAILNTGIYYNTILVISLSLGIMGFLFWFLQKTKWGLAVRVTASSENTALLMGVPTKRVTMLSWATAAALGTLAAIILAPLGSVQGSMMIDVQVNAFFAAVLGGFSTFYGPVISAFLIAFSNSTMQYYVSFEWGKVIVYLIILIFLIFKPFGLFGKKAIKKV